MSRALALVLLAALLALQAGRAGRAAFEFYPYLKLHGDEPQTTREALLYRHLGRGTSLNYVYGGGYPSLLSLVLRATPPGRLSFDDALGLAKQSAPVFHIWGRLLSLIWSLVAIAAFYFTARAHAPPLIAVGVAALPVAAFEWMVRSSGCLIDMQGIALSAVSTACLVYHARAPHIGLLTAGAVAFGAAVSTKYNTAFLLVGWLAALGAPRGRHFVRFAVVSAVVFFTLSPQIALHPVDALNGILFEARHQRSGFTADQVGGRVLWIFTQAASPGDCPVWLMAACAALALRRPELRPAALAFWADVLLVGNGGFHQYHYLMPAYACGMACVAAIAHPVSRLALAATLVAIGWGVTADLREAAKPDTRVAMRALLSDALPPGTRMLMGMEPQVEPELPLNVIPVHRWRPGGHGDDIWKTAEAMAAEAPDAALISMQMVARLDALCASTKPGTPFHAERAALAPFWPPNATYRESLRLVPTPEMRGPEFVLLVRTSSTPAARPR